MGVAEITGECPEEFVENPKGGESFFQPAQVCVCVLTRTWARLF